ncbi:hypothetical protein IX51_08855 [uncultured archaeon]|nr:hypothetical protein IX51_08855 [uncultured archaeon]
MSKRVFGITSFAHFANDGSTFLYPVLITFLYTEFPATNLAILGVLAIMNPIVSGAMSTPVGILADKLERKGVLIALGLALNGVAALFFAFSVQHGTLEFLYIIIGVTVLGFGQSFYHPIGSSILRSEYGRNTPMILGINGSFGSFGRGIFPLIIAGLIGIFGLVEGMFIMWALGFTFAAVVLVSLGLPKIKGVARSRGRKQKKSLSGHMSVFKVFIFSLMTVVFLRAMVIRAVATYGPSYLANVTNSQFLGIFIFTMGVLTPVAGQTIFGIVTTRKGGFFSITTTTIFSGLAFFLLLLSGSNAILDALFFSIYAFFTYSGFPTLLGYLNQVVPKEISTSSGGIVWGVGQFLGGAAGIALSSFLVYRESLYFSFWIMLIFTLSASLLLPFLKLQEKNSRDKAEVAGAQ